MTPTNCFSGFSSVEEKAIDKVATLAISHAISKLRTASHPHPREVNNILAPALWSYKLLRKEWRESNFLPPVACDRLFFKLRRMQED